MDHQVNGPEKRSACVRAQQAGKPARWELVFYTPELRYAKSKEVVLIAADGTQDSFGSGQVIECECR